ncbi:lipid-binding SYLF domain-containing protein [Jeongeupia chitinilytica]|uniref:Ysc84 actin-binding domain-containing protein n=1 Tax=Jeongeupia chitinilytica TaxID=1041641 RepID=A0ABQ3H3G1_9NEIS|nr:YSC84-related protein [Jeongeupia chitinilytica]GHD67686.1 hypothetical protein GCM10007350_31730 [Jeongeupia chitinilytica]
MRRIHIAALCGLLIAGQANAGLFGDDKSPETQRSELKQMASQTLTQLYKTYPSSKAVIARSAGYAVFDNFSAKIMLAGGNSGQGIAVNRGTGHVTYMDMLGAQAGLGLGAKSYRQVFVFKSKSALNEFIRSGWQFGAQANASAKADNQGADAAGATSVAPGVWMYQMTETGLAAEATLTGSKYSVDDELN